jgi:hypothetical protein
VVKQWSWHILAKFTSILSSISTVLDSMDILWNKHAAARTASFHVSPVLKWTSKGPCQINQSQAHCEDSKQGLQVRVEHSPKLVMVAPSLVHANPIIHNECFQFSCREIFCPGLTFISQYYYTHFGEWVSEHWNHGPTPSAATCQGLLAQKWGACLNSKNSNGVTRIPWRKVLKERSKLL